MLSNAKQQDDIGMLVQRRPATDVWIAALLTLFILLFIPMLSTPVFATELVGKTDVAIDAGTDAGIDAGINAGIDATRRGELVKLVRQDCGSCHGLTLKGGLGPALLPDALQHKSAAYLKTVILHGLPDTAMPPWQRFVSEAEAEWIVTNLQKGFPLGH